MAEDRGKKGTRSPRSNPLHQIEIDDFRRDRLLAALTLILGAAFCLGLPFALQAGAEFFLPLTAAIAQCEASLDAGPVLFLRNRSQDEPPQAHHDEREHRHAPHKPPAAQA